MKVIIPSKKEIKYCMVISLSIVLYKNKIYLEYVIVIAFDPGIIAYLVIFIMEIYLIL